MDAFAQPGRAQGARTGRETTGPFAGGSSLRNQATKRRRRLAQTSTAIRVTLMFVKG